MTVEMCKTKRVQYNIDGKKYSRLKYVCPDCDSIALKIQRGHSNLAKCECSACGHTWRMRFREESSKIDIEIQKYRASVGLHYRTKYDRTAPFEEQFP